MKAKLLFCIAVAAAMAATFVPQRAQARKIEIYTFNGPSSQPAAVSSVTLNYATASLSISDTLKLTANVLPANASNKSVLWESSNTAIVTVASGMVVAVGEGSATVTAKAVDGEHTATYDVTVAQPVTGYCGITIAASVPKQLVTWDEAMSACPLGWRLPTRSELQCMCSNRLSIDGFYGCGYWSSTESSSTSVWNYHFGSCMEYHGEKTGSGNVRCVK